MMVLRDASCWLIMVIILVMKFVGSNNLDELTDGAWWPRHRRFPWCIFDV
jgi:hypothetical protein